jgi:hypothetical protein
MATPLETIRKKAKELQAVKNISYQAALKKAGADYRAGKLSGTKKTTAKKQSKILAKKSTAKVGKLKEVKKVKHCVNVAGVKVPTKNRQILPPKIKLSAIDKDLEYKTMILNRSIDILKEYKHKVETAKTKEQQLYYKKLYNNAYDHLEILWKHIVKENAYLFQSKYGEKVQKTLK